ncbi:MAG: integrase/recombinase XerD [Betaproteobacteria bacterium]|nr:integrase/recombinase XerD [Betaproteobacteria bacterium]
MGQKRNSFRLIVFRPNQEFATQQEALEAAGIPDISVDSLNYFDLPLMSVIVADDGLPQAEACNFLLEKARSSRGITGDTVRSYGEALCDWLEYLQTKERQCSDVTEETLGLYRLHLLSPKPKGRGVRANTANHRLVVAAEFHRWGQKTQTMQSPLGAFLDYERRREGAGRLLDRRYRNNTRYLAAVDKRLPKVLTQEEIVRIFHVAPHPFGLMFRWAIATGMRRVEICDLRLGQLPSPAAVSRQEGALMMIDVRRKGGRCLSVAVPSRLVEETSWYVTTERTGATRDKDSHVFVGQRGKPISRVRMSKVFRECATSIGSTATLHHLRHTFAVNVLSALDQYEGSGQAMNPLKCVQVLLGHASLETTQIYLEALSMSSDAVRQALDYLYGGTIERNT